MRAHYDQISAGIIGTGGMGGRHAENLHARVVGARVAGVFDADAARAKEVAARCGSATVFQDARDLIRDEAIDAVVISSPDDTHAALVLECVRNGKPVLCEKPLAASSAEAREVVAAEARAGRKLVQVGFMRRYDPQHVSVKEAVASGAIGRPLLFKGWHRNAEAPPGATSEFVVFSSAIHDLDSARWLLGQEIEEVYVRGASTDPALGGDACDLQLIQASLSSGCLATIEVYVNAGYGYEVGAEVVGERGTARTAPMDSAVVRRDRALSQQVEGDWLERFQDAYSIEVERWIEAVGSGRPAGPDAWDGYVSLVAAEACVASLKSGLPHRLEVADKHALYSGRGLEVAR